MIEDYKRAVRGFEGFTAVAQWDYAQHSNGFGTRALYPGEKIDSAEAHRRFDAEIEAARKFVDKVAEGWDEGTKAALTSLTFNAGTRWASSGLGEAVRNFDVDAVRSKFLSYTKAGGVDLPGLVRRRLEEVTWIGNPSVDSKSEAVHSTTRASAVAEADPIAQSPPPMSSDTAGLDRVAREGAADVPSALHNDVIDRINTDQQMTDLRLEALLVLLRATPRQKSA